MTDGYRDCLVVLSVKELLPLVRHAQGVQVPPEELARVVTVVGERVLNAAIAQGPSWRSEWRIIVPHDAANLSPNARMHPGRRIRLVKEARTRARLCWMAAGSPVASGPVVVSAIIRRGRRLADLDNQIASLKPLLDGIFNNALTPDDSERFVRLGEVSQETGARWRLRPEVEFIVREVVDD